MQTKKLKILIQRGDRLGDVVCSLGVVETIRAAFPTVELHFLTSKIGATYLEGHPHIDHIQERPWKEGASFWVKLKGLFHLVRRLKQQNYYLYISLWNDPWLAYLGKLIGIPVRIGDSTNKSLSWLYTHTVRQKWENYLNHQVELNLQLLGPLLPSLNVVKAQGYVAKEIEKKARSLLAPISRTRRKKVLFFTATGGTNVPIPVSTVKQFCEIAPETEGIDVILCGQAAPESELDTIEAPHVLNLINHTSLKELEALISLCDYYIGPDTGPTHIAWLFSKPMVFFSSQKPNPPARWGPFSPYFRIIRRDYTCRYFCAKKCHPNECFSFLTANLLLEEFQILRSAVQTSKPYSYEDQKYQHLLKSLRVLNVSETWERHQEAFRVIPAFRRSGLMVFGSVVTRWSFAQARELVRKVIRYNITVLQGPLPWWVRAYVTLMMGTVHQYQPPVFVSLPIHRFVGMMDYISLYKKACAR